MENHLANWADKMPLPKVIAVGGKKAKQVKKSKTSSENQTQTPKWMRSRVNSKMTMVKGKYDMVIKSNITQSQAKQ